jgi:Deoxycytidylate deaminase
MNKHEYAMILARTAALRSTCLRRKVGAVAISPEGYVLATAYNGAPCHMEHCTAETCVRIRNKIPSGQQLEMCRAIHAEQNLVLRLGPKLKGATVYCTTCPCVTCAKLLIGAGVAAICWENDYDNPYAKELMTEWSKSDTGIVQHDGLYWIIQDNCPC